MSTKKPLSPFLQFMFNMVASSLEQAGEPELVKLLNTFHKNDAVAYEDCIKALHAGIVPLKKLVAKTPGIIDDGFVNAFDQAITDSANANGIEL